MRHDTPTMKPDNSIGKEAALVNVMIGETNNPPLTSPLFEEPFQPSLSVGVQACKWFIEQNQHRLVYQCACDGQPPANPLR